MTDITVSLPDDLVRQARKAGLLRPSALESLLREAVRKQHVDRLFATMDKLAQVSPSLTEAEIEAEIEAARAERRAG